MPEGVGYKNVQLPSGEVVAFPGDMADDEINRQVRQHLISQQGDEIARRRAPEPKDTSAETLNVSQAMGPGGRGSFGGTGNVAARGLAGLAGLTASSGIAAAGGVIPAAKAAALGYATEEGLRKVGVPGPVATAAGMVVAPGGSSALRSSGGKVGSMVLDFVKRRLGKKAAEEVAEAAVKETAGEAVEAVAKKATEKAAETVVKKAPAKTVRKAAETVGKKARPSAPDVPKGALGKIKGANEAAKEFGLKTGEKMFSVNVGGKPLQYYASGAKAAGALKSMAAKRGWKSIGVAKWKTPAGDIVETDWTRVMSLGG